MSVEQVEESAVEKAGINLNPAERADCNLLIKARVYTWIDALMQVTIFYFIKSYCWCEQHIIFPTHLLALLVASIIR